MAINAGKRFEASFKASIPDGIYHLRLKDGTASWDKTENTRFQHYNPCDMLLHYKGFLFLLELKSHQGKSIPFACFRETQLKELYKVIPHHTELAMAVFNFRELEETYLVHICDIQAFIYENTINDQRKSFPIEWVREVGYQVPQRKKRVNYDYDIVGSLESILYPIAECQ